MGLLSQSKREAKRLLKEVDKIALINNQRDFQAYHKIQDIFYQLKGYKDYDTFEKIMHHKDKLEHYQLLNNLDISPTINKEALLSKKDINLLPLNIHKVPQISASLKLHSNVDINYLSNLVLLTHSNQDVFEYASNLNTIFITDNKDLSKINTNILSFKNSEINIDPLNPLIGDIFSIKYFFGEKIFLWVNEILVVIKKNDKSIDIKQLENLFNLPQLIEYSKDISSDIHFNELKKYLYNLFLGQDISVENITDDILDRHFNFCHQGLIFASILKNYDCFQNNPNYNFYTNNTSLSVVLSNENNFDKIVSNIVFHTIFQCIQVINLPYSAIVLRCSCDYLANIKNYYMKRTIFVPYLDDFYKKEYKKIINIIFDNSKSYLFNLNSNLLKNYLPNSFFDKVCNINDIPIKYRKINRFSELKTQGYLYFDLSHNKLIEIS